MIYWGVRFHKEKSLLYQGWLNGPLPVKRYEGEPTWPLLFKTRQQARAWAQAETVKYRNYPNVHPCRSWKITAVKVKMQVTKC